MTICPHCEKQISNVNVSPITGNSPSVKWNVVSYDCPSCRRSLGMQIDPIAIKTDTIKELKRS